MACLWQGCFLTLSGKSKSRKKSGKSLDDDSLLIPKTLPTGDLSHSALPIFLREPADTFVFKTKPAILHCAVAHALAVHFQCNAEVVHPTSTTDLVEPETGVRYTEATVKVSRDQLDEFFGDFHCACVATSGKGSEISRYAVVSYACECGSKKLDAVLSPARSKFLRCLDSHNSGT